MDRRLQVQKAAFEIMGKDGLEAVHARTVGARLGINHATVHYYFPSRGDLLAGVAEYALVQLAIDRQAVGVSEDPRETIDSEIALAEAYAKPTSLMGRVLVGLAAALPGVPQLREPLTRLIRELRQPLQDALPKAKLRKSTPFATAEVLSSTLFGLVVLAHLDAEQAKVEPILDEVFSSMFKG